VGGTPASPKTNQPAGFNRYAYSLAADHDRIPRENLMRLLHL
jgi:hypothetical protein